MSPSTVQAAPRKAVAEKQAEPKKPDAEKSPETRKPADFKSKNFLVHTDLPPEEAKELLARLETMLSLISKYWTRPNRQTIECYVVKDVANWPEGSLDPEGVKFILAGGGVTRSLVMTSGDRFQAKSFVYARAERGTPLHEAVHAYCSQTFGRTGPLWYSEGMAEMGNYWQKGRSCVNCDPIVVRYLRENDPKPLLEIVNGREQTGDSWQNYAWRWALCHLLANNVNYRDRFRPLGISLLTGQKGTFEDVYGPTAREIMFEYEFFVDHLDHGYEVELTSWDWKTKFKQPEHGRAVVSRVDARKGWQATRLAVKSGEAYDYAAEGAWKIAADGAELVADGNAAGQGKLEGVLFSDYKLSEPFELGAYGTFTALADGDLFVRCRDAWHEIADNSGHVKLQIKRSGDGSPLKDPRDGAAIAKRSGAEDRKSDAAPPEPGDVEASESASVKPQAAKP